MLKKNSSLPCFSLTQMKKFPSYLLLLEPKYPLINFEEKFQPTLLLEFPIVLGKESSSFALSWPLNTTYESAQINYFSRLLGIRDLRVSKNVQTKNWLPICLSFNSNIHLDLDSMLVHMINCLLPYASICPW